jgi:hypothetical protein
LPIITNLVFYSKLNYEIGTAYNIGNTGMLYAETGDDKKAMNQINIAINLEKK